MKHKMKRVSARQWAAAQARRKPRWKNRIYNLGNDDTHAIAETFVNVNRRKILEKYDNVEAAVDDIEAFLENNRDTFVGSNKQADIIALRKFEHTETFISAEERGLNNIRKEIEANERQQIEAALGTKIKWKDFQWDQKNQRYVDANHLVALAFNDLSQYNTLGKLFNITLL